MIRATWWPACLAIITFGVALATRSAMIGEPPIYDELYQMLPAFSWKEHGTFEVLDGVYDRAAIFTRLIAISFEIMGSEHVAAARLIPSIIPGALLVTIMFLWTRAVVGTTAGWFVLVFLLLWPNGIEVSQYIRFYALQGLLFVSGALLVYGGLADGASRQRRAWMLAASVPLFLLAINLQMLTLIGLGAIGIWIAIVLLPIWLQMHRWLWLLVLAVVAGGIALLASGLLDETIQKYWTIYRWMPWPHVDDRFFYHRNFRDNYPTFWPLFPLAALVALRAYPRVASFCLILFATTFVMQSFGGLKNIRYLYPTMPFFFVLWAAALQALLPKAWAFIRETAQEALTPFLPRPTVKAAAAGVLTVSLVFTFGANAAFERASQLIQAKPPGILLGKTRWTWPKAREMAAPWLAKDAVVVTSEEMLAIQWLGDFDITFNRPRFSEIQFLVSPDAPPFTLDSRTGRPVIGLIRDFERIIACEPVGIFITNRGWLSSGMPLKLIQAAQATGAKTVVERGAGMALFGWHRDGGALPNVNCTDVPTLTGSRAADRLADR